MSTNLCPHCGQPVRPTERRVHVLPNIAAKPVKRIAEIVANGLHHSAVIDVVDFYREAE